MAAVAPLSFEQRMGSIEDDEDSDKQLVALRLAALSTIKAKNAKANSVKPKSSTVRGVPIRDGYGNRNNAVFQRHHNSNLIAIVPISPGMPNDLEQPRLAEKSNLQAYQPGRTKREPVPTNSSVPLLALPQHRYCKTKDNILKQEEKSVVKTKFNRYDNSSSESSEESEDEESAASCDEGAILVMAAEEEDSLDKLLNDGNIEKEESSEIGATNINSDNSDSDSKQSRTDLESNANLVTANSPIVRDIKECRPSDNIRSQDKHLINVDTRLSSPFSGNVIPVAQTPPKLQRSPDYMTRSRSKSPACYLPRPHLERSLSRSRSRSRSRLRLGRSRSPRRYVPRRSMSPKRRAISPRYLSPRRRSPVTTRPSPHRHMSPLDRFSPRRRSPPSDRLSPGRRRLPSPRRRTSPSGRLSPRRYGSPPDRLLSPRRRSPPSDRLTSPHRRLFPGDRSSPWRRSPSLPRRHYSPGRSPPRRRMSPIGRISSPRRRKSPSPVKRNPSPPRRFSPQRRSPLLRRVSPPRRNPSPPRKLYPIGSQPTRAYSPRRYQSPSARGLSPRRYNSQQTRRVSPVRINSHPASHGQPVGDILPWSPPRNGLRPVSPHFNRKKSISPRPRNRRGSISSPFAKSERKSISPRPRKRRDSMSPQFEPRQNSMSPKFVNKRKSISPHHNNRKGSISPRPDSKRRKAISPRFGNRRGSTSPNFVVGNRRKSNSPRLDSRKGGPTSPRFVSKRRGSISPKGPRLGSGKRSKSPNQATVNERRRNSPTKSRRPDERDARAVARALRDGTVRERASRSISLSPSPDRIKDKSPLRVRVHRHERVNGKKRSKSKKSREKTSAPIVEKTEKSSVLEARRRKFESVDPIKPANKKIRLRTAAEEFPGLSPDVKEEERVTKGQEIIDRTTAEKGEDDAEDLEDALILDSPANLWSDDDSDSDNEGRFKSSGRGGSNTAPKVGVLSFNNLLQPTIKPESKWIKDRIGTRERRSPARDRKRKHPGGIKNRLMLGSVKDRIGERPARGGTWKTEMDSSVIEERLNEGSVSPDIVESPLRLPALLSKDVLKIDQGSKLSNLEETAPDPSERVSRLDSTDQQGDLRAALSRKRAARSAVLFPHKGGDVATVPGTRLVQSAFLDVVGKKHMKRIRKPSLMKSASKSGELADARRVTVLDRVRASVKQLSASVTLATDESTLTSESTFTDGDLREEDVRKPPIRLRLGLTQHTEENPGGRKVKLKRNNATADQV